MKPSVIPAAALIAAAVASPLAAQATADDTTVVSLDAVVVSAERTATLLGSSVASVSRIDASELRDFPKATVADALRQVPGFALVSFDGLGGDPQLMVRGFYGGGENEYAVVLLDGRPFNQMQNALVAWDAIPLSAIEAIEVVRGGSSALYGDAAIGAVINIITRDVHTSLPGRWSLSAGEHETFSGDADVAIDVGGHAIGVSGAVDRTDGFRDHAERASYRLALRTPLLESANASLDLMAHTHIRDFDDAGSLLGSSLEQRRSASEPIFRFDNTEDRTHMISVLGDALVGDRNRVTGSVTGEYRDLDVVRTLPVMAGYGDTKERVTATTRGFATAQLELDDSFLPGTDVFIVGADLTAGRFDSDYFEIAAGTNQDYLAASGERGALDATGTGSRAAAGAFAQYSVNLLQPLRLVLGARFDAVRDAFEPGAPAEDDRITAAHDEFSPKAGLNLEYARTATTTGSVYFTAGRSFKAPTLDQLFDQRSIGVPGAGYSVTLSNEELRPQYGVNLEAGVYHGVSLMDGRVHATASATAYHMRMRDEIDLDLATFRYVNIGRSLHRGIETGLQLQGTNGLGGFANYTLQAPTHEAGDYDGNHLKNIPRHVVRAGVSIPVVGRFETGVTISHERGAYMDDANELDMPFHTRVDARASWDAGAVVLFLDARNLLDAKYNTISSPDPMGTGEFFHYPAAGRVLEIGVRSGR